MKDWCEHIRLEKDNTIKSHKWIWCDDVGTFIDHKTNLQFNEWQFCPRCGTPRPAEKRKLADYLDKIAKPGHCWSFNEMAEEAVKRVCEEIDAYAGVCYTKPEAEMIKQHLKDELL